MKGIKGIIRAMALALIGITLPIPAYASFNGFYVGAGGGIVNNIANTDLTSTAAMGGTAEGANIVPYVQETSQTFSCRTHGNSALAEIYAGWGCHWASCFYFGARLGVNFSSFDLSETREFSPATVSERTTISDALTNEMRTRLWCAEYTLDLRPGFLFCKNTMIFGVVGVAFNRGEMCSKSEWRTRARRIEPEADAEFPALLIDVQDRRTQAAFRLGFGLEQKVSNCLSVHITYIYTTYRSLSGEGKITVSDPTTTGPRFNQASFSSRPKRHAITVGFSYYL